MLDFLCLLLVGITDYKNTERSSPVYTWSEGEASFRPRTINGN